jgi:uncharacterized protein (UPF0332 family)
MYTEKAQEVLRAAQLCFGEKLYNSTANRAYYAMFQAAIAALERIGVRPNDEQWSHENLQAEFAAELIHRRKIHPRHLAGYLPNAMRLRHQADYRTTSVSKAQAEKVLRLATEFVQLVDRR